jgi:hypothetical protein
MRASGVNPLQLPVVARRGKQWAHFGGHLVEHAGGRATGIFDASNPAVEVLHLIRQDRAADRQTVAGVIRPSFRLDRLPVAQPGRPYLIPRQPNR